MTRRQRDRKRLLATAHKARQLRLYEERERRRVEALMDEVEREKWQIGRIEI